MRFAKLSTWSKLVDWVSRKLKIDVDLSTRVINYALDHGVNLHKLQSNIAMLQTYLTIIEEIKVESVLKWELAGQPLLAAQRLQKTIDDPDAVPIKDLHITLASGPEWKKVRKRLFHNSFPDPKFRIDFDEVTKISHRNRTSWYARVRQQKEMEGFVDGVLGSNPDLGRVYHVSLANLTGKSGDSVALVEKRDYKTEYKKFQSSEKMKKYRAELNRYNHKKGTYGNHDGKDASHKGGKIVGMEDQSTNRGRKEKSRLKGSKRK